MKFGVRECANIVFRAKTPTNIGKYQFQAGQPVLYIDTATTSSVEQATTTVYAQGGRGNVRLVTWEGEKTLTFTVEDALLSPVSLAMLSGADLFQGSSSVSKVHFHDTASATIQFVTGTGSTVDGYVDLSGVLGQDEEICATNDAPIYVIITEPDGSLTGEIIVGTSVTVGKITYNSAGAPTGIETSGKKQGIKITNAASSGVADFASGDRKDIANGKSYAAFIDYYLDKVATKVDELQIAADNFAGNYYVEAETLFRRKSDGVDMPANLTFPNVKIQSNLTFQLSGTGDPSTFTFTMDALPGYTYFDKSREVMCVIQVIEDQTNADKIINPVMPHNETLEHKMDEVNDITYLGFGATEGTTTQDNKKLLIRGTSHKVAVEDTLTLTAIGNPTLGQNDTVTWKSSNQSVATVSAGTVTGVAVGKTTITASVEGYKPEVVSYDIEVVAATEG